MQRLISVGSSGSAGTAYRLDSQDSTASVDGDAAMSSSNTWNSGRQPSVSLREWDIPYEDLTIGEKIGSGRFSTGETYVTDMTSLHIQVTFMISSERKFERE